MCKLGIGFQGAFLSHCSGAADSACLLSFRVGTRGGVSLLESWANLPQILQDRREGLTFSGLLVRPYESSRPWLHQCCGFHWGGIILHTISSLVLLFEDM